MTSGKMVASHICVFVLGLILGYEIPILNHSYRRSQEINQVQSQIKQDPNNADNWASLGVIRSGTSDTDGAIAAYRKALELDSSNVTAYLGMGNLYYKEGNFEAAEKWYADALQAAQKHNSPSEIYTAQQLLKYAQGRKAAQRK